MKKAIVTGITGQDGAYLSELLLEKNYKVYGTYRRSSSINFWRIEELGIKNHPNLKLVEYDLTDESAAIKMISEIEPDEVYNLAAQSFVGVSFEQPLATAKITAIGVLNLLEAIKIVNSKIKFYQASTSELFGKAREVPQDENTPFYPRSPYGFSKLFAHWATVNYRESYGMFSASGILFNHESPLRGLEFVTRKITDGVAKIYLGFQDFIEIGNMYSKRDWGYARDYVQGIYQMLQMSSPEDFVLATGKTHSVKEFIELAFSHIDIKLNWQGTGVDEVGIDEEGIMRVKVNPIFYRPAEVDLLIGNPKKAKEILKWEAKTDINELCKMMVEADIARNKLNRSF
jgi:GDPmannose 4,6-dehydratase